MLPLNVIGPVIVTAVNLPLGAWALARGARQPAYRLFALFALSLLLWNLGERFPHSRGEPAIWLRLAFLGMSLAPAAFLSLALSALDPAPSGRYGRLFLFIPALLVGLLTKVGAQDMTRHALRRGFYNVTHDAAVIFVLFAALYVGAALVVSYVAARRREEDGWVFRLVMLPLAAGLLLVLGAAWLRRETTPTLVFWTMAMAQVAMYLMLRFKMVTLEVRQTRGAVAAFSAFVVVACVLLLAGLSSLLFEGPLSQEIGLVLVITLGALLVLYAAVLPKLEELAHFLFKRK